MKLIFVPALLFCISGHCQFSDGSNNPLPGTVNITQAIKYNNAVESPIKEKVKLLKADRWRMNGNKYLTGGLLMLSGAAKGFNETLEFNWHGFAAVFPKAKPKWFYPQQSFKNKYKDGAAIFPQ